MGMRFVGIDIAAETHVVAAVSEDGTVVVKPTPFTEDAAGYAALRAVLGAPTETLIALEATGHYWQNLVAVLLAEGFAVTLLNPLRTRRFAGEDLQRAKTDALDALGIARFAAQKRPAVSRLPDPATQELRELVRLRDRVVQDLGDRVRQLHRLVDLGFPEFTRHVRTLDRCCYDVVNPGRGRDGPPAPASESSTVPEACPTRTPSERSQIAMSLSATA